MEKLHSVLYYLDSSYNQSLLNSVIQNYSQLRSFHNWPRRTHPIVIFCNVVAQAFNATLESKMDNYYLTNPTQQTYPNQFPTIITTLDTIDVPHKTPSFYLKLYSTRNNTNEFPLFVAKDTYRFNFVYCDIPKRQRESLWSFTIFTSPFDIWTWILLILSLLTISKVTQISVKPFDFIAEILSNISSLLSSSIGTPTHKAGREKSFLFILWISCGIIIHTFYVGMISSLLVRLPEENVMKNLTSLYRSNYKLVYADKGSLEFVKSLAISAKFAPLINMLNAARVLPEPNNLEALAFKTNVAVVYLWTYAFNVAAAAKVLISKQNIKNAKFGHRESYVGKELWNDNRQSFFGVIPPKAGLVYTILQRLVAAGIYRYWYEEYEGLAISKRVQDRVKFVSPTKIRLDEKFIRGVSDVPSLKMSGKIKTIFCVWTICLGTCVAVLFLEMFLVV